MILLYISLVSKNENSQSFAYFYYSYISYAIFKRDGFIY